MGLFDDIAERRILAAQDAGEFDRLPGHGRPLVITEDFSMPIEVRMAQRRLQRIQADDRFTLAAQLLARRRHRAALGMAQNPSSLSRSSTSDCEDTASSRPSTT